MKQTDFFRLIVKTSDKLTAFMVLGCFIFMLFGCSRNHGPADSPVDYHSRKVYVVLPAGNGYGLQASEIDSLNSHAASLGYGIEFLQPSGMSHASGLVGMLLENNANALAMDSLPALVVLSDPSLESCLAEHAERQGDMPDSYLYDNVILMESRNPQVPCHSFSMEMYGAMYIAGCIASTMSLPHLVVPRRAGYESVIRGFSQGYLDYVVSDRDLSDDIDVIDLDSLERAGEDFAGNISFYTEMDRVTVSLCPWLDADIMDSFHEDSRSFLIGVDMDPGQDRSLEIVNIDRQYARILILYIEDWLDGNIAGRDRHESFGISSGYIGIRTNDGYEGCFDEWIDVLYGLAAEKENRYLTPYQGVIK